MCLVRLGYCRCGLSGVARESSLVADRHTTYTGTSGALNFSSREGASSSGNERFGGTVTLDHVVVSDGVHTFRAVGAASFSGGTNAQTGTVSDRGNFDIHILDADGPVARVRINARLMNDGSIWVNDQGDCEQPD